MENYRRTIYGGALQTATILGIDLDVPQVTTLNEKLGILATATLGTNERPLMRYFSIGIGGHAPRVGANGQVIIDTVQHRAKDSAPYRMIPFAARPLDSDFSAAEREKYALRRLEVIKGAEYAVYYLRRIDMSNVVVELKKKTIVGGVATVSDFVPSAADLSPVPPVINPGNVNVIDGEYVYATAKVTIDINEDETADILSAVEILYDDVNYAFLSEICFVTGVDRQANTPIEGGSTTTMTEVACAQAFCHVAAMQALFNQRKGFTATYDVGIGEPMFNIS